jgi:hypothetical protein
MLYRGVFATDLPPAFGLLTSDIEFTPPTWHFRCTDLSIRRR